MAWFAQSKVGMTFAVLWQIECLVCAQSNYQRQASYHPPADYRPQSQYYSGYGISAHSTGLKPEEHTSIPLWLVGIAVLWFGCIFFCCGCWWMRRNSTLTPSATYPRRSRELGVYGGKTRSLPVSTGYRPAAVDMDVKVIQPSGAGERDMVVV